jgi:hypothetical protein
MITSSSPLSRQISSARCPPTEGRAKESAIGASNYTLVARLFAYIAASARDNRSSTLAAQL